jgi:hypothetical protein
LLIKAIHLAVYINIFDELLQMIADTLFEVNCFFRIL